MGDPGEASQRWWHMRKKQELVKWIRWVEYSRQREGCGKNTGF
jgi:hypothetical protein